MKALFILCDTLNRRMLDFYGASEPAFTPNLDRLARRGVVFDNHWCGSAPCMPARRDLMTGRLNFLEKPWGGIEPFDQTIQSLLSTHKNVHTQLFSDHAHYIIPGGENYTKGFTAWQINRGQEGDPVWVRPGSDGVRPTVRPDGWKGEFSEAEEENKRHFVTEHDYPSVKTLHQTARWLEENHDADNFFLWAECFDPHEPYDCPKHYLDLYEKPGEYEGSDFTHPDYQPNIFDEAETRHLRNRCKALTTMTDRHLGEIFDVLDRHNLWEDTLVILTTDHGYHLGEHGYMAKNYMPPYNEVFHIPLLVAAPGAAPGRSNALTQATDMFPTLLHWFGVGDEVLHYNVHGRDLLPAARGETDRVHDDIIFGYFGKQVGWTDGKHTYFRAAKDESNRPLNVYCSVASTLRQYFGADDAVNRTDYGKIELGRFLSWTNYPLYRFPADIIHWTNGSQEFMRRSPYNAETLLFDIQADYAQEHPLDAPALEVDIVARLRDALRAHDAPPEQLERLGI